ncbi:hypothetical protein SAMD00024442_13_42 [Candidatus Symbiothrix dinenymphae]|nr:hypothetical protein SAMD00024442_13_42 [Candidatus Symbiothrix dinenymphae]
MNNLKLKDMNNICINAIRRWSLRICSVSLVGLFACSEAPIGQYPTDSTPPKPVSNPQVVNFPGGASITYDLPDETDLLYVKASFVLPNGTKQDIKVSSFSNTLTVNGFARSQEYKLQLIAVDRSQNESVPVEVPIHPEDANIYDVRQSVNYTVARGGFNVNWENANNEDITVFVLKKNEGTGNFSLIESFYSAEKNVQKSVRGLDAVLTTFAVFARDKYNNNSDTVQFQLEPLFEQFIDHSTFAGMPKLPAHTEHATWCGPMSVLWDDVLVAGAVARTVYYISPGTVPAYFTIDLGIKVKLSRFKLFGREDYYFRLHNPRDFYILGTNDLSVAQDPASTDAQWGDTLLNCISHRPSGLSFDVVATPEDYAYASAGEDFEFPEAAPAVRYIRIRVRGNGSWSGTNGMHLAELRFWGEPIN